VIFFCFSVQWRGIAEYVYAAYMLIGVERNSIICISFCGNLYKLLWTFDQYYEGKSGHLSCFAGPFSITGVFVMLNPHFFIQYRVSLVSCLHLAALLVM
jgi:hypothetical protein